jgi:3-carboxy-cis,cis-muconate cycloisomerase
MAQDLVLLGQTEIGEVRAETGGGSSTMPQKANPIRAETVVALARANAGLLATMHQALIQEHERGGVGWTLEWLTLPQMTIATGSVLGHAQALADGIKVDAMRMTANLAETNGLILAEAVTFALAEHLPRAEAVALVKAACETVRAESRPLIDIVRENTDLPLDWAALGDPSTYLGSADRLIDQALAAARGVTPHPNPPPQGGRGT